MRHGCLEISHFYTASDKFIDLGKKAEKMQSLIQIANFLFIYSGSTWFCGSLGFEKIKTYNAQNQNLGPKSNVFLLSQVLQNCKTTAYKAGLEIF